MGNRGSYGAREMIAEAQLMIDTPRPADTPPVEWYMKAMPFGDLPTIAMATLRDAGL